MAKKSSTYSNESISSLKGAERVRRCPAVIFGSDGLEGCEHSVFEIISNSLDEAREGYGDRIIVTRYDDNSVEVQDFGRGAPVDFNTKENCFNWELLYCEMYAGGKYNTSDDGSYQYSLGLNGLGLCSTQYSSEYMDVEIKRDGYKYNLHFEHGENIGGLKKEPYAGRDTGTCTKWRPDIKVFTGISIPLEYYMDVLKRQAVVNSNVKLIFRNQNGKGFDTYEFRYENGIVDYIKELSSGQELSTVQFWQTEQKGRDRADMRDYKVKVSAAVCFSNKVRVKEYYHNSSWLEYGGAPEKATRSAFVSQIDAYIKSANKYNKNESRISFQDVEESLVLVVSSFSTVASFENQTKKSINNRFIQDTMTDFFRRSLEVYFIENKAEADKIADQILINKRSRERSEKERLNLKSTMQSSTDVTNRVEKFSDCRSRDPNVRELFIVEGDSAKGACMQARDPGFQAIMPIRGKILNCLKAEYPTIFKSPIITDLVRVMGCGVEVKTTTKAGKDISTFNMSNLRFNKIIICTDADVDGFQIRTLVLTMLYRLTPTLIEEGKVFIAETPLFEITTKDKTYFAYSDTEKSEIMQRLGNTKCVIQRSKGLGENEPQMMSLTTMNPATRRMIKIMPSDAKRTSEVFDLLLGDNLQGRKDFIALNGAEYLENADLS